MLTETITTPEFVPFYFPDEPVIKYKKLKSSYFEMKGANYC